MASLIEKLNYTKASIDDITLALKEKGVDVSSLPIGELGNVIRNLDMSYSTGYTEIIIKEPTCTESGEKNRTCNNCNTSTVLTIEPLGHDYESVVTDPTCTTEGYTTHTCTRCGDSYVDNIIDILEHDYDYDINNATIKEKDGKYYLVYKCKNCDSTIEEEYSKADPIDITNSAGIVYQYNIKADEKTELSFVDASNNDITTSLTYTTNNPEIYVNNSFIMTGNVKVGDTAVIIATNNVNTIKIRATVVNANEEFSEEVLSTEENMFYDDTTYEDDTTYLPGKTITVSNNATVYHNNNVITGTPNGSGDDGSGDSGGSDGSGDSDGSGKTDYTLSEKGTYTIVNDDGTIENIHVSDSTTTGKTIHTNADTTVTVNGEQIDDNYTITDSGEYEIEVTYPNGTTTTTTIKATTTDKTLDTITLDSNNVNENDEIIRRIEIKQNETYLVEFCDNSFNNITNNIVFTSDNSNIYLTNGIIYTAGSSVGDIATLTGTYEQYSVKISVVIINADKEEHCYQITNVKDSTCAVEGEITYTCVDCGNTYIEKIPVIEHDFAEEFTIDKEATCTETGSKSKHCSRCNEKTEITEIPMIEHTYNEWKITKEPTCSEIGIKTYTCSQCNHSYTEEIPMLEHDYEDVITAPTCTTQGYTTHICSNCNDAYIDTYTDALGTEHNYDTTYTIDKYPTTTETGIKSKHCSRCNEKTEITEIPMIDDNHEIIMLTNEESYYSEDGINWEIGWKTKKVPSYCEYGNGKFVNIENVSNNISAYVSNDGYTWNNGTFITTADYITAFYFANSIFYLLVEVTEDIFKYYYSTDGITWLEHESNIAQIFEKISPSYWCCANNMFVGIGTNYSTSADRVVACYSTDGFTWTIASGSATSATSGICWAKDVFCAIHYKGSLIYKSRDGITWGNASTALSNKYYYYGLTYGNGVFLVTRTGALLYSTDAIYWDICEGLPTVDGLISARFIKDKFVTFLNNTVYYSIDGKTWEKGSTFLKIGRVIYKGCLHNYSYSVTKEPTCTEEGIGTYTCFKCGNTYDVTIEPLGHDIIDSVIAPTCINQGYTLHKCSKCDYEYRDTYTEENPVSGHNYINGVCQHCGYVNKELHIHKNCISEVTVKATCTTKGLMTYTCLECNDVYTEEIPMLEHDYEDGHCSMCGKEHRFICVGNIGTPYYSLDGETWTAMNGLSNCHQGVCYGNGRFICVGNVGKSYYSLDGETWTAMSGLASGTNNDYYQGVCYGNGRFVCVGFSGKSYYSIDGETWTAMNGLYTYDSRCYYSVCYGNDRFVCVGEKSSFHYSIDGKSWITMSSISGSYTFYGVCYGNDRFVCVGASGKSYYSLDGETWTAMNGLSSKNYYSVCYGNDRFVCVGASGSSYYSLDGETWTAMNGLVSTYYKGVCYGNGRFVCVGNDYKSYYSIDGETWTAMSGLGNEYNASVCCN